MKRLLTTLALTAALSTPLSAAHAAPPSQGALAAGSIVSLAGTPHIWIADDEGALHWNGDTRALATQYVNWESRMTVSLAQLRGMRRGDPWLSAGLLKDGDPIYLVKWETNESQPRLLHIQSIADVELFGINGGNYGNMVIDRPEWEAQFGMSAGSLQKGRLEGAAGQAPPPTLAFRETAHGNGLNLTAGPVHIRWGGGTELDFTLENVSAPTLNFEVRGNLFYLQLSNGRRYLGSEQDVLRFNDFANKTTRRFTVAFPDISWEDFQKLKADPKMTSYKVYVKNFHSRLPEATWQEHIEH